MNSTPQEVRESDSLLLETVMVTYGHPEVVRRAIAALLAYAPSTGALLLRVVDNDSPDATPDLVEQEFPSIVLYRQPKNAGFAVANNIALRDVSAPFVLVLNPDTELCPGVLDHLIAKLENDPTIGMIGCRLVTAQGQFDHAAKRSIPDPSNALRYFLPYLALGRPSNYVAPRLGESESGDVEAISGAFMLIRTAAMREVGYFDERYWMYGEDLDWCVRFRSAGWRIHYDGRFAVTHLKGVSSGSVRRPRLNWHFHKSMAIFYRTHYAGRNRPLDWLVYGGIMARFVATTAANQVRHTMTLRHA